MSFSGMRWRAAVVMLAVALADTALVPAKAKTLRRVLASPLVEEGSDPDGCTAAVSGLGGPAAWEVRVERFLLDGKSLVEVSRQPEPNRFPLCIAERPVAKNAEVELSFVVHGGRVARAAGIVFRFADPQDYYAVTADMLAGRVRLIRVLNGERVELAGRAALLSVGKAQTLKVKAVDDDFVVSLDGKDLFEAHDDAIVPAGRFGLWSRADSVTSFGDLFITILD
jgi:hypothetical protein